MLPRTRSVIVPLFGFVLAAAAVHAQSTFANIVGTVADQSGAIITQVSITATNVDENIAQTVASDESGNFQFLNLKPGRYQVSAEKSGFAPVRVSGVTIDARQERRVDLQLRVASVGQTVDVSADATTINTENATIADTKDGQQVLGLPVNYRGATTSPLATLVAVPGVQQDSSGQLSIGGGFPSMIEFSLDGISTVNVRNNGANTNMYPSSELISEFRVSAVNNNAEFAQTGDVTVTTKSGGNQFHGSAFEYLQNRALDSTIYGAGYKQAKTDNTFGASLGGPVLIPRLYNGRNRTFFFADFEENRLRGSTPEQYSVPSAAERAGDLSSFGQTVIDPFSGNPFPNARIPANRLNSVATKLLNGYYPLPNTASQSTFANYRTNIATPVDTNGYDLRADQVISSKQQIFARWSWKALPSTGVNTLLPSSQFDELNRNLVISYNYALTPSLLNEFRFGLSLWRDSEVFPIKGTAAVEGLGITGLNLSAHPESGAFPTFNFSDGTGFTTIGREKDGTTQSTTYQYVDNLSWVKGRHTMKFGFDARRLEYRSVEHFPPEDDFGQFTFNQGAFTGNALGDLLLGLPASTLFATTGPDLVSPTTHYGFYAQDEFRVTPRLTVSYGLRYELHLPFTEKNGNISNFDRLTNSVIVPDHTLPASQGFLYSINACPGYVASLPCSKIITASQAHLGEGLRKTYFGNYDPRISIAYRPFGDSKTVVRAGFGIFTMSNTGASSYTLTGIHTADTEFFQNFQGPGIAPLYQFPKAYAGASLASVGSGEFIVAEDPYLRDPESAQWNVTVERQLPADYTVRASYIGMNSYRLPGLLNLNQVRPSTTAYDPSRKPYQNWDQVLSLDNVAFANYQAFQLQLDHRFGHGLFFQASYTLAKNLTNAEGTAPSGFPAEYGSFFSDRFNTRNDRGNDFGTRRHRVLVSGIYQIPAGRGQRYLSNARGFVDALLGGWKLSTVSLFETGPYETPTISASLEQANINAAASGMAVRPDRRGNGNLANPTPGDWFDINAFVATPAGAGRVGNAGVGILEGPGTVTVAGGLAKEFPIREFGKLRFEASFTNLFNHPNFAPPQTNISVPSTFGVTTTVQTAENSGNRVGQVALRLEF